MRTLANNDLAEIKIYALLRGQIGIFGCHYSVTAVAGGMTDADLAAAFNSEVDDLVKAWYCTEAVFKGIGVRIVRPDQDSIEEFNKTTAGAGTAGATLPTQLTGIITKRTNKGGPRYRGRMYPPFPGSNNMSTGQINAAGQTVLFNLKQFMLQPGNLVVGAASATISPVVWGRAIAGNLVLDPPILPQAEVFTPITSMDPASEFATQRRRGFFGKVNSLPTELA